MNIFIFDKDPAWNARFHSDRLMDTSIHHIAHTLMNAHAILDGGITARARVGYGHIMSPPSSIAVIQHPWAKWVRSNSANYDWTASFFAQLVLEHELRRGKIHAMESLVDLLRRRPINIKLDGTASPFPQVLPDNYIRENAVDAYRQYFWSEKEHIAHWGLPAREPEWYKAMSRAAATARSA